MIARNDVEIRPMRTYPLMLVLVVCSILLGGCDFNQVISDEAQPFNPQLFGTWKSGEKYQVVISKSQNGNQYVLKYKEPLENAQQEVEFTGWIAQYGKRLYFHLQTRNVKQFLLAEIEIKADTIEFRRLNRDFPEAYNPDLAGEVGLINLSTEQLRKHIDENHDKQHFFWDTVIYKKVP